MAECINYSSDDGGNKGHIILSTNTGVPDVQNGSLVHDPLLQVSKDLMFVSLSVIVPFGLVFNTLSLVVFLTAPMRKRSTSIYLAVLAASDNLSLLTVMFEYWLKDDRIGLQVTRYNTAVCVFLTHLSYASRLYSALLITSFTVERFVGVVYPLQRASLSTHKHVRRVVLLEAVISVLATAYVDVTIAVVQSDYSVNECDVKPEMANVYLICNVVVLIFFSIVIPILIIVSLNMFILKKICGRRLQLQNCRHLSPRVQRQGYNTATLLLVISSAFVVLNLPYCVAWFISFIHHIHPDTDHAAKSRLLAAKYISSVVYNLNYSINFLLYSLCARVFRQELHELLCLPLRFYHSRRYSRRRSSTTRTFLEPNSGGSQHGGHADRRKVLIPMTNRCSCQCHQVRNQPTITV